MSNLASLTQAAHQNAERQEFAREMMSGNMSEAKYKTYLYNMWLIYDILEDVALSMGVFGPQDLTMPDDDLPLDGLTQADDIWADYEELGGTEANPPTVVAATEAYRSHIIANCQHDKDKLMAHVYVRHMGDLSGGQMIAAKVPGSGKMYQFAEMSHSVEEMKVLIKRRTTDAMAPEATIAFDLSTQIFEQLNDLTY
jgi:heme oxygenase|tara:strand:- start:7092 stop:7682 length:591 start_codon:yes stop_codon:yes gene_type:complete